MAPIYSPNHNIEGFCKTAFQQYTKRVFTCIVKTRFRHKNGKILKNIKVKMTVVVMVDSLEYCVEKSKTVDSMLIHCLQIQIICRGLESQHLALRAVPLHFSFLPFCRILKLKIMKLEYDFEKYKYRNSRGKTNFPSWGFLSGEPVMHSCDERPLTTPA